jgi:hypothetical protein
MLRMGMIKNKKQPLSSEVVLKYMHTMRKHISSDEQLNVMSTIIPQDTLTVDIDIRDIIQNNPRLNSDVLPLILAKFRSMVPNANEVPEAGLKNEIQKKVCQFALFLSSTSVFVYLGLEHFPTVYSHYPFITSILKFCLKALCLF